MSSKPTATTPSATVKLSDLKAAPVKISTAKSTDTPKTLTVPKITTVTTKPQASKAQPVTKPTADKTTAPAAATPTAPGKSRKSPAPGTAPLCPRCKSVLTVTSGKLPELCPTCHFILRAERQKAFNHNFWLAFRKTFVWRGRSTRREFWGFTVIMGGIGLLLALALDMVCNGLIAQLIAEYIAPIPALPELLWYILTPMLGAALLVWVLALPLPLLSLTIRRLHDVGHSMLWLVIAGICWLGAGLAASASALTMLLALLCGADAAAAETAPIAALIEHSLLATLVLGGIATIFTLAIGMFSLMDSQRGSNKYGPSAKYPLE